MYMYTDHLLILTQYASSTHTVISSGEVLVQHPLHNLSDVVRQGLSCAQVDSPLVHLVVSHGRALKDVERPPHISLGEGHQTLHAIRAHLNTARKLSFAYKYLSSRTFVDYNYRSVLYYRICGRNFHY